MRMETPTVFKILGESTIWICDTGASSHSTKDTNGAVNEGGSGSADLGQAGSAVKATNTIDLTGQFCAKDGSLDLKTTLTDAKYNKGLNFNLMDMSRLLQNSKIITRGNATFITTKDGSVLTSWFLLRGERYMRPGLFGMSSFRRSA